MKRRLLLQSVVAHILMVFMTLPAFAQQSRLQSDPFRDPIAVSPDYNPPVNDNTVSTVITIDDYDNFKLGIDFAECSIANNPQNPLQFYAAWNSTASAGGNGYYTNDGYTWTVSNPTWSWMWGDVVVAYDSIGRLAFQNLYGIPQAAKVAMSVDNGMSWSSPVQAIVGYDKNWLAVDQSAGPFSNYLYSSMSVSGGGNVSRSTNHGSSWNNTNKLSPHNLPGMMLCVGPENSITGGALYAVTNSGDPFEALFTFYKSTDGGLTFSLRSSEYYANTVGSQVNNRNAVLNTRTRPYPYIVADNSYGPHRGRLYLVYASNDPPGDGNKPDIFLRYSDDGALTWTNEVKVNDDLNTLNNYNWFPAVWHDKNTGRLYISWMDTRDCPTADSCLIYATYTYDGVTFMPNQKVSNKLMKIQCPECGGGETPLYQGDYNGIAANSTTALLAWTDLRDNNFGSYVGYFPDFALKTVVTKDSLAPYSVIDVVIPGVKLYSDTVFITASINGSPGLFNITYPSGNKCWTYPNSIPVRIDPVANVPAGEYVLSITANGSNGTPVHKRTATFHAVAPAAGFDLSDSLLVVGDIVQLTDRTVPGSSFRTWVVTPATHTYVNGTDEHSGNPYIRLDSVCKYSVSLTAENATGSSSLVRTDCITVIDSLHAEFQASDTLIVIGGTTTFSDLSSPSPSSRTWSVFPPTYAFTAGTDEHSVQPVIRFDSACSYSVTLTVSNFSGSNSLTRNDLISVLDSLQADFVADDLILIVGDATTLRDLSTPIHTERTWSIAPLTYAFMNGTDAHSAEPVVRFDSVGSYAISLTVTNFSGTDSMTRLNYITVIDTIRADFAASDTVVVIGNTAILYENSSRPSVERTWTILPNTCTFISGTDEHSEEPVVRFDSQGSYSVSLTVTDSTGTNSLHRENYILVVDSVKLLHLTILLEGLFNGTGMNKARNQDNYQYEGAIADEISVRMHGSQPPYPVNYGPYPASLDTNGHATLRISPLARGYFYISVLHRNSIETWTSQPLSFYNEVISYDMTDSDAKAYGNNLRQLNGKYLVFSGDVNQDGLVDSGDLIAIDNDAAFFSTGYLLSDLNGDGLVDAGDMIIVDNNSTMFVTRIIP